jgi:hypothetical protein
MGLCIERDFGQPGARHHDACRSESILVPRVEARGINGMRDGEIVGVHNQEFRIGGVA